MIFTLQLLLSIILDALLGDPKWYPHPVRLIGALCSWSESMTRRLFDNLYLAGFVTVMLVILCTGTIGSLLFLIIPLDSSLQWIVAIVLLYTTIAAKDLLKHSKKIHALLQIKNTSLDTARVAVGRIVGRDTRALDETGICRACIETVAENMVDAITAPLFFAILASFAAPFVNLSAIACSAIGALLYRAINTMDSMIGYKNDRYIQFGLIAAKLDDLMNFIPARISGLCIIMAAFILQLDYKKAMKIYRRDRLNTSSPNAGHTEASVAGALDICLGGPSVYFGTVVEKPYLGDTNHKPVPADIKKTNSLVKIGTFIFFVFLVGLRTSVV